MKYLKWGRVKIILVVLGMSLTGSFVKAQSLNSKYYSSYQKNQLKIEKGTHLKEALKVIEQRFDVVFLYRTDAIQNKKVGSTMFMPENVSRALQKLLKGQKLVFKHTNLKTYGIYPEESLNPKEKVISVENISGQVTDAETGNALASVNIKVKGTTNGTFTDAEGNYKLNVNSLQDTLIFSSVGYQTRQVPINGRNVINVSLNTQALSGEEMVVVGYGTQKRGSLTGTVSSLDESDIGKSGESSIQQSIQGKISGVRVTQTGGGKPGGALNINIRGIGSINSDTPLYVIDGVPIQQGGQSQLGQGVLNSLNPDDIKSIDILKDASAAAIYGSRASGGVVLITTKQGTEGPVRVNLKAQYGSQVQSKRYDVLNANQYATYLRELHSGPNGQLPGNFMNDQRPPYNTNWQDALFQPAPLQNYNIDISGGSDASTYSIGLGYHDEQGTMVGSGFDRYSLRTNSKFNITDNIEVGENFLLSRTSLTSNDASGGRRSLEHAIKQAPTVPVYNKDFLGGFGWPGTADGQDAVNPVATGKLFTNETKRYNAVMSAYGQVDFFKYFTYKLKLGLDFRYQDNTTYNPRYEGVRQLITRSSLSRGRDEQLNPLVDQTLKYAQTFGKHDISALAGFSIQSFNFDNVTGTGQELPAGVISLGAASTGKDENSTRFESSLRSLFGRLTYAYNDKYLLTANIRRDESSKLFKSTDPVGIFPSVSVGWRISNEPFLSNADFISHMKLTAGWGELGNQSVLSNYPTTVNLNPNYFYEFGNQVIQGIGQVGQANPSIDWETSVQTDIGLDMGLWDDMLSFKINYYDRKTKDLLLRAQIPPSVGLDAPFINAGTVDNRGIEFSASYQQNVGDVFLNFKGNFTTISNNVESLGQQDKAQILAGDIVDDITNVSITQVGEPIGQFYGYVTDGIFQNWDEVYDHAKQNQNPEGGRDAATAQNFTAPGDLRFKDINGDGTINPDDKTIIGNPIPDFTYGFTANIGYKNFDLNVFVQGTYGNDVYNGATRWLEDFRQNFNQGTAALNRWTESNPSNTIPRATRNDPNQNILRSSDRFVENASYLRLKNLTLGYTFDNDLISATGARRFRIYVSARNLLTITPYGGLEPEIGSLSEGTAIDAGLDRMVYPQNKTFLVGVELGF